VSSRDLFPGPIGLAVYRVVEVIPLGVAAFNLPDLPGPGPFLHRLFTLNGKRNIFIWFNVNKPRHAILPDEAGASSLAMLENTAGKVVGDADVESAVFAARENINPISHSCAVPLMGPGNKPQDDK